MKVSVIISTYNSPDWLEKVLWGYQVQTHRNSELLIADDGSGPETAGLIARFRRNTRMVIRHIWHEDRGFRKCTILNKAIQAARSKYLVFTDGDCIPRRDFVERHASLARTGCMLSGGYVRLPMGVSRLIAADDVVYQRATDPGWLRSQGMNSRRRLIKLSCGPRLGWLFDALTTTRATFNGCNTSAWKEDVLAVNGFDERMEWGGLDRELGERLVNAGVRPIQVRHRAVCVHLDHKRDYIREASVDLNSSIRRATRQTGSVWTPYGIVRDGDHEHRRAA